MVASPARVTHRDFLITLSIMEKHPLCILFLCLVLTGPACSRFDESVTAYEHGDYATASQEWQRLARLGYPPAMYNLGVMYLEGNGVPQDNIQAYRWLNLASSRGYRNALKARQLAADSLTEAQRAEAQRLVREWWMLTH